MTVIEVKNLTKRYGDRFAVRDVTFTVERGEIFGILGPNGAGKTTTVECITGVRHADGGTVRVLDRAPSDPGLRQTVGVQLQQSQLPDKMRVGEALDLFASFYASPVDPRTLAGELDLARRWHQPYKKLSGGQQQRLSIGLALIGNPQIAVLDELTTGLDPSARRDTWALVEQIRDRGVTVVLVSHFMDEAERLCDRIAVIDRGRVTAIDTPAALVASIGRPMRVRFRPSVPLVDLDWLAGLASVDSVAADGDAIVVTGRGDLVATVAMALAERGITPRDLTVNQTNIEDAFIAITGHTAEEAS
jgi:ABC-2 type transport system ATP-binding protein